MIVRRLLASFGTLNHRELRLGPGLNIITAPNESGKSTWCAFLRTMLYGVNTLDRDKTGYLSDKTRYRPWSGAAMEGSIELVYKGKAITIERKAHGSAPMKQFRAFSTETGEKLDWLSPEDAGELLTGVSERIFERSAFIRQSGLCVSQTAELEKRIASLVSTGDEQSSYTEADERLRTWQRRRRYNKTGLLPVLEAKLAETAAKRKLMEDTVSKAADMRLEIERLTAKESQLREDLVTLDKLETLQKKRLLLEARRQADSAAGLAAELSASLTINGRMTTKEDVAGARADLTALQALHSLQLHALERRDEAEKENQALLVRQKDALFAGSDPIEVQKNAEKAEELARQVLAKHRRSPGLVLGIVLLALIAAASVCALVFTSGALFYAAIAVLVLSTAILILLIKPSKKPEQQLTSFLSEHHVSSAAEFTAAAQDYITLCADLAGSGQELQAAEAAASDHARIVNTAGSALLEKVAVFAPDVRGVQEITAALHEIELLQAKLSQAEFASAAAKNAYEAKLEAYGEAVLDTEDDLVNIPLRDRADTLEALTTIQGKLSNLKNSYHTAQGELRALGDPMVLDGITLQLQEEHSALSGQYDALSLAVDTLREANEELQERFAPFLSQAAGAYAQQLTAGRYEKLYFTRTLEAAAKTSGDTVSRDLLSLSEGTVDQLYLALRLAICELVLPGNEPCPIILDDALTNFDDGRAALALNLLKELSADRQILLFTCHSRERDYFKAAPAVTFITEF